MPRARVRCEESQIYLFTVDIWKKVKVPEHPWRCKSRPHSSCSVFYLPKPTATLARLERKQQEKGVLALILADTAAETTENHTRRLSGELLATSATPQGSFLTFVPYSLVLPAWLLVQMDNDLVPS